MPEAASAPGLRQVTLVIVITCAPTSMMELAGAVKKFKVLISLTTKDNDYQEEQALAAETAARRLGLDLEILYADNDAITQSQQLLKVIQSSSVSPPDAIIFEPVGATALPQVAKAAAAAGIGWVVLNRDVDYIPELRRTYKVPVFAITSDHDEIGRIQGQQFAALLPNGGSVLHVQGPAESLAARQRTSGMYETKPANIQIRALKAQWTEASSQKAVSAWLRLSTSRESHVDLIAAHDDSMAIGARKAFQEHTTGVDRERWLSLPFLGCDGVPKTGQAWVKNGILTATVVVPTNTDVALAILAKSFQTGAQPEERRMTVPNSFPTTEVLAASRSSRRATAGQS
jgi:ribose transport system substrate-binding protein